MDQFEYCGACLVTGVKMYNLSAKYSNKSSSTLGQAFARLLQIPKFEKNHHVCFECARLMSRFQEFKSKCLKAQSLLADLRLVDDPETVKEVIQNVDRKFYKLISNLTFSYVITTNSTAVDTDGCKTVDAKPNVNAKLNKEVTETEITYVKNGNTNIQHEDNKNLNKDIIQVIEDSDGDNVDVNHDNQDNEYRTDDEGTAQHDEEQVPYDHEDIDKSEDDGDDLPTEYINYSEGSCDSDNVDLSIEDIDDTTETISDRKINIESDRSSGDENDLSDDEPPLKVLNKIITKNVANKSSKSSNLSISEHFAVVNLTPGEARTDLLLRKESANYKSSRFKCEFCYVGFSVKRMYNNHMRRHCPEYGKFECDLCHLRFSDKNLLCRHHVACHKKKYFCKVCPYTTCAIEQVKTHINLHKKKKYPSEDCGDMLRLPKNLLLHSRKLHKSKYVCELCECTFRTPRALDLHKKQKHLQAIGSSRFYKCPVCDKSFNNPSECKQHIQRCHKNVSWPKKIKAKQKSIGEPY